MTMSTNTEAKALQIERWDCHVHLFDAAIPVIQGHYKPADATLAMLLAHGKPADVQRFVFVQPSVYGTDCSLILQGLKDGGRRHRAIIVVDETFMPQQIPALHVLGVRGIRINQASPVGQTFSDAQAVIRFLEPFAQAIRDYGWHVQWFVKPESLPMVASVQRELELVFVLDHLAGLKADVLYSDSVWEALTLLAAHGAYVKLSALYRLGMLDLELQRQAGADLVRKVIGLFPRRTIWGSDWPHTNHAAISAKPYQALLRATFERISAETIRQTLGENPLTVYD